MYLEDIFTVHANITGNPAISLLYKHSNGMPFSLQLLSEKFSEGKLLSFSSELMKEYSLNGVERFYYSSYLH